METFGYMASALMGLTLGLIGAGGSIMVVPILVYLFSMSPLLATTQSLFIVGVTAMFGSISYLMKREIQIKAALYFVVPSFVGVYLVRAVLLPRIPQVLFKTQSLTLTKPLFIMILFSVLMIAASVSMIRKKTIIADGDAKVGELAIKRLLKNAIAGFLVGGLTSLIGAGGGFLIIPSLVFLLGLTMREAVGTSLIIIASNSLFGFFSSFQRIGGSIDWKQMLIISALGISGIFIGSATSKKVSERSLKIGFGYFVLMSGTAILLDQFFKLYH